MLRIQHIEALSLGAIAFLCIGCTGGHFRVHPVPGGVHGDPSSNQIEGFRYFLPKPYLMVTNMTVTPAPAPRRADQEAGPDRERTSSNKATAQEGSTIAVQLIWLPDTKQQYAISVQGGRTGTFKGGLQLANGWMLVGVNEEFDTKTVETLNALTGALGTIFAASGLPTKRVQGAAGLQPFLYLFEIDVENHKLVEVNSDELKKVLKQLGT